MSLPLITQKNGMNGRNRRESPATGRPKAAWPVGIGCGGSMLMEALKSMVKNELQTC